MAQWHQSENVVMMMGNDKNDKFDLYDHVKQNLLKRANHHGFLPYHDHTSGVFFLLCTLYHLNRKEAKAVLQTLARQGYISLQKRGVMLHDSVNVISERSRGDS